MRLIKVFLFTALLALIVVPVALALRFTDEAYHPPVGYTGQAYHWSFTGAGGCGPALPYSFKVLNGSLPPGLTLDTSGLVHGVPTQTGDYTFWLQLSDENPPSASWCVPKTAEREMTISIRQGLNIAQNALSPKATFVNRALQNVTLALDKLHVKAKITLVASDGRHTKQVTMTAMS